MILWLQNWKYTPKLRRLAFTSFHTTSFRWKPRNWFFFWFFCLQFLRIYLFMYATTFCIFHSSIIHTSFPSSSDSQQRPNICKLVCTKATVALIIGYMRSGLRLYYHTDSAWYNYGPDWLQSELIDWKVRIIDFDRTFWKAEKLLLKMAFRLSSIQGSYSQKICRALRKCAHVSFN